MGNNGFYALQRGDGNRCLPPRREKFPEKKAVGQLEPFPQTSFRRFELSPAGREPALSKRSESKGIWRGPKVQPFRARSFAPPEGWLRSG